MKRPRGKGGNGGEADAGPEQPSGAQPSDADAAKSPPPAPTAPTGRKVRVRSRLIIAVAVAAAAVAGAGAPALLAASDRLADSQSLVTLAERTQRAVVLAHALSDERDEITSYIAAGRPKDESPAESGGARVDRQIAELRAEAPRDLREDLDAISGVRRAALTGKGTALETHTAYSDAIAELRALTERLADRLPPRAGSGIRALADLDRAVEQAAASRGLLRAALATPRPEPVTSYDPVTGQYVTSVPESPLDARRDELTAAAQRARIGEDLARTDFERSGPGVHQAKLRSTVTGPEITKAEKYLARLTDKPTLTDAELDLDRDQVDAALTARVDQLRSVENSLTAERTATVAQLRDDDVTALELRIAIVGACLLLAVGVTTAVARTLTRPLAVLRLGTARLADDPATDEPVRFTGRNDEFAQVVRSVNELHTHTARLRERLTVLESDRKHLVGRQETLAAQCEDLRHELAEAGTRLERVRHGVDGTFVNLALRTLGLVERQLAVIENLEDREQDPERLSTLFKLDHFATVMRRHNENLLILAGTEHKHAHPGPVPLIDVLRAAVSEIERYERVRISSLPQHAHLAGFAADDISHLVAELLENATSFSPPDAPVEVSGWLLESGEVMLSVQDRGIGIADERLRELNTRLTDFDPEEPHDQQDGGLGLGLYVVARLAGRHGVRVQLREQKQGGVAAVAVLPKQILAATPSTAVAAEPGAPVAGAAPAVHLPGSEAEANSNVLRAGRTLPPSQPSSDDPLITAAEQTLTFHRPTPPPAPDEPAADAGTAAEAGTVSGTGVYGGATPQAAPDPAPAAETPDARTTPVIPAPRTAHAEPTSADGDADTSTTTDTAPPAPKWERVTDKGLPKRTPRITTPAPTPARAVAGSVDAEALRRRLGGFHQGARDGRRDVEAELSERSADTDRTPEPDRTPGTGRTAEDMGDTAEEARS
ncbi:sensor histidine kinase [Streptomyces sp. O3]